MAVFGPETINLLWLFFIWFFNSIEGITLDNEKQQINFHGMEVKVLGYQVNDQLIKFLTKSS